MRRGITRRASAFTLVELLTVAAVIAVLAGALGAALRAPGEPAALEAAQLTLGRLCAAARLDAALAGQSSRLVIAADPGEPRTYLRFLQIVTEDPACPGTWRREGGGLLLARRICLVPPPAAAVPGNPGWPATRRSTALPAAAQPMTIDGASAGLHYFVQFTSRGTTGGGNLVLTVAEGGADEGLRFNRVDDVRGVLLRPSGAITLLNDAGAFSS